MAFTRLASNANKSEKDKGFITFLTMMMMLVGRDKESGQMLIMSNNDGSKSDSGNVVFGHNTHVLNRERERVT